MKKCIYNNLDVIIFSNIETFNHDFIGNQPTPLPSYTTASTVNKSISPDEVSTSSPTNIITTGNVSFYKVEMIFMSL